MKIILLILVLLWISAPVFSTGHHREHDIYEPQRHYSRVPEPAPSDPTQKIIDILLGQGVAGIGLIVLGWWIKTSSAEARADRLKIEERVFNLVEKTNETLGEYKGELENVGRELERIRGTKS